MKIHTAYCFNLCGLNTWIDQGDYYRMDIIPKACVLEKLDNGFTVYNIQYFKIDTFYYIVAYDIVSKSDSLEKARRELSKLDTERAIVLELIESLSKNAVRL